jgi:hypothetical protein
MSKVKQAIELALENVNNGARNTFTVAKIYTFEQVAMILQDILEGINEDGEESNGFITDEQLQDLADMVAERIDGNINDMNESDMIDEDSIEMSISGGRASVDNLDLNKDNIIVEAQCDMDDTIASWAAKHGLKSNS